MKVLAQALEEILESLQTIDVAWEDDVAHRVIDKLEAWPIKKSYKAADLRQMLDEDFDDGLLICRLFLGLSKDRFTAVLSKASARGTGVTEYRRSPDDFLKALLSLGVLRAMAEHANRRARWSDVLIERLRSGRGSAISGQRRGRKVEDFTESIVREVFRGGYDIRCAFSGLRGKTAKCDFAIPSKSAPRIVIESKGYGATGSKMTDIIGDIEKIIAAKRADTAFLFFTDGQTWNQRKSDLRKIVEYQNEGHITRIYTFAMSLRFKKDLQQLKRECGL